MEIGRIEDQNHRYYRNGWRFARRKRLAAKQMNCITNKNIEELQFSMSFQVHSRRRKSPLIRERLNFRRYANDAG